MSPQKFTFKEKAPPRAAWLPNQAIDEHRELIRNLYLDQDFTRHEVVSQLAFEQNFVLSVNQLSKATGRWGFYKKPQSAPSVSSQPSEAEAQESRFTTSQGHAVEGDPSSEPRMNESTDPEAIVEHGSSKRTRSIASSVGSRTDDSTAIRRSPYLCPPAKRSRPRSDLDLAAIENSLPQAHEVTDSVDFVPPDLDQVESNEIIPSHHLTHVEDLWAEYLACSYHYNEAFGWYVKALIPFQKEATSDKQRRARMLDMARSARSFHNRKIIRVMMETELSNSNDPLTRERNLGDPPDPTQMCPIQSFIFHRHLADTYAWQHNHTIQAGEHFAAARNFSKNYDPHGPLRIDLWALICLVSRTDTCHIRDDLLDALECDEQLLVSDIKNCLLQCRRYLIRHIHSSQSEPSLKTVLKVSENMNPIGPSYRYSGQNRSLMWDRCGPLFSFLWKSMSLQRSISSSWGQSFNTISETQFLMVVCTIICNKSPMYCESYQERNDVVNRDTLDPVDSEVRYYCAAIDSLLPDDQTSPREVKREFTQRFVDHYSWSPPTPRDSARERIRDYQLEALESVLASYKRDIPITAPSVKLKDLPETKEETLDDSVSRLGKQEQRPSPPERPDLVIRAQSFKPLPSFTYPSRSSLSDMSLSAHQLHLSVLRGNPTIARSIASHSSRSSRVSISSSFRRFKEAAYHKGSQPETDLTLASTPSSLKGEEDEYHSTEFWSQSDVD